MGTRTWQVYEFVKGFLERHGYAPAMVEIARGVGLRSKSSVAYHLGVLEDVGLIVRRPRSARAMRIALAVEEMEAALPHMTLREATVRLAEAVRYTVTRTEAWHEVCVGPDVVAGVLPREAEEE